MIYIEATGSNKKIRDEVEKACKYFIQRLMPRLKNLDITIELIRKLKEKDEVWGDCTWEDQNHCPREFTIRLDSTVSYKDLIDTLAHEMVHVRQYVRGELVDLVRESRKVKWRGKRVDWYDSPKEPWEKEPNQLSPKLYREWISYK